ncbi:MAG: ATP-grasp domain-containing protein [Promethearchaeota archaeon]
MEDQKTSILVVGFNTRPLVYSLNQANYYVYAVDFFGDLDLYPYVNDYIIVTKELSSNYFALKDNYSKHLAKFALTMLRKNCDMKFLLIGSGLDDAYKERELIYNEINNYNIVNANNDLNILIKARDNEKLLEFLKLKGYQVPKSYSFEEFQLQKLKFEYPFILKKKRSAGGINVFKIGNEKELKSQIKIIEEKGFLSKEWLIQEFIDGIPISCTVISNGKESLVISINQQIIGEKLLNAPKEFMYCGNIVPAEISREHESIITEISLLLTKELGLKGINGFDFVLKNNYPYFMECNPRIPGSIRASEIVLNINLLDLNIKSFIPEKWSDIKKLIKTVTIKEVATKLIYFAPKEINKKMILKINNLKYIHDKSEPNRNIIKGEPLCSILYKAKSLSESHNGALKIVNKINAIIK